MKIKCYKKNVYGNDLIYPVDFKKELEDLTGKRTLNNRDLDCLKKLGFEIEFVTY
jgi:ssDNA-specific exonuclease RecJ